MPFVFAKVAQLYIDFLGNFEKHPFKSKNWSGYILGNLWINLGYFLFQHLVTLLLQMMLVGAASLSIVIINENKSEKPYLEQG